MNEQNDNPYQTPQANIIPLDSEKEEIRTQHIRHEATIKSIGILYYLGSTFLLVTGVGMIIAALSQSNAAAAAPLAVGAGISFLGVLQFWIARKLRALSPKAKIPATILSTIGLAGFPIGTLVNLYVLYAIHCKKGRYILSDEYQEIVEATPDIKYQTSILVWIFLAALVLLIGAAIIMPLFN